MCKTESVLFCVLTGFDVTEIEESVNISLFGRNVTVEFNVRHLYIHNKYMNPSMEIWTLFSMYMYVHVYIHLQGLYNVYKVD